jgi:hypothetical protein
MRHFLVYTDMNLLEDNINTMKKITEALMDAGLEVYVVLSPEYGAKS